MLLSACSSQEPAALSLPHLWVFTSGPPSLQFAEWDLPDLGVAGFTSDHLLLQVSSSMFLLLIVEIQ